MPLHLTWQDIALRLLMTLAAGALIGFDRERGHAAGLRTTMLVCLAASVAMIETNLLLETNGKAADSFAVADVLRLPLGILSGMGFIGAGAIVHRQNLVSGVTTAATLWIVTVIGLCLGAGHLALGAGATLLAVAVLWGLKRLERLIAHERRAVLTVRYSGEAPLEPIIRETLGTAGYRATLLGASYVREPRSTGLRFDVRWQSGKPAGPPEALLQRLSERSDVVLAEWNS